MTWLVLGLLWFVVGLVTAYLGGKYCDDGNGIVDADDVLTIVVAVVLWPIALALVCYEAGFRSRQ